MAEITGASLNPIYNRLNGIPQYHPLEADTFADWSLEAGDIVTVTRDGKSYQSPIHNTTVIWKKGQSVTVRANGNEKRDSISKMSRKKYNGSGAGLRNNQFLRQELWDAYNGLASYFEVTESRLYAGFIGLYDGLMSNFEITRSRLYADFYGAYDGLKSAFEVTRSRLRAEFYGLYDGLSSAFEVTRSRLYVEFKGLYDGLQSNFEVTRSRLRVEFYGYYDGLKSTFEVTRSRMYVDFYGQYDGLKSMFEVTRSRMYAEFQGQYDGLKSSFEVTRSRFYVDFYGYYDGLKSAFEVTRSRMYVDFYGQYDGLKSAFEVTRSRMAAEFYGQYDGLRSAFEITRSRFYVDFYGYYDGLKSAFEITRSRFYVDFYGQYDGLKSAFEITRSRMYVDFYGQYDGLKSAFEVTRSRMYAEFKGQYDGLSSSFEVTRSQLVSQFSNYYTGLSSRIEQNSSKIGLVVTGNSVNRAAIIASINNGTSNVNIEADNINLTGSTLATKLYGENVTVHDITIQGDATYQDGIVASSIDVVADGDASGRIFGTHLECDDLSINDQEVKIYDAQVSQDGTTLTIYYTDGTTKNFNKAAALTAKGTWSDGTFTVSAATPEAGGVSLPISTSIDKRGESRSGNIYTVSIGYEDPLSGQYIYTGKSITIDASAVYTIGRNDTKVSSTVSWEHPVEYTSGDNNTVTFTTDAPDPVSGASKSLVLYLTQDDSWTSNKKNVYLRTGGNKGNKMAAIEITAPSANSYAKATFNTSYNRVEASVVSTSGSPTEYYVDITQDDNFNGSTHKKNAYLKYSSQAFSQQIPGSTAKTIEIDATSVYNDGRLAVSLTDPIWGATPSASPSSNSNSMTVKTSNTGRQTELQKSRTFYLSSPDDWANGKKKVYLSHTDTTTTTNRLAFIELTAPEAASNVTVTSIYGISLASTVTRTSVQITAAASNGATKTENWTLSTPTTYTDVNGKSHKCVNLTGKYYDSGSIISGVIGRVNIDSTYEAGWNNARNSVINKTYSSGGNSYNYFPGSKPTTVLSYIKVARPSSTVDAAIGSSDIITYYLDATSDNNTAYIRYNSSAGPIVAQVKHDKYTQGAASVPASTANYNVTAFAVAATANGSQSGFDKVDKTGYSYYIKNPGASASVKLFVNGTMTVDGNSLSSGNYKGQLTDSVTAIYRDGYTKGTQSGTANVTASDISISYPSNMYSKPSGTLMSEFGAVSDGDTYLLVKYKSSTLGYVKVFSAANFVAQGVTQGYTQAMSDAEAYGWPGAMTDWSGKVTISRFAVSGNLELTIRRLDNNHIVLVNQHGGYVAGIEDATSVGHSVNASSSLVGGVGNETKNKLIVNLGVSQSDVIDIGDITPERTGYYYGFTATCGSSTKAFVWKVNAASVSCSHQKVSTVKFTCKAVNSGSSYTNYILTASIKGGTSRLANGKEYILYV